MAVEAPPRPRPGQRKRRRGSNGENLPRLDQQLYRAKNENRLVTFHLATECVFTDNEGTVEGVIIEVDKYAIKVEVSTVSGSTRQVWLSKSWIVGTEIDGL